MDRLSLTLSCPGANAVGAAGMALALWLSMSTWTPAMAAADTIPLPTVEPQREHSLDRALRQRRTVRDLQGKPLSLPQLARLLWAAQGVTEPGGRRTAPSAGALYPLESYVVVGDVAGLGPGVFRYLPRRHALERIGADDRRAALAEAALGQFQVAHNGALLVFTALPERTMTKYGRRGMRYVHMEVGHAAQNVLLQATAMGLAAAVVGAFNDRAAARILGLRRGEQVLYLIAIGYPSGSAR
jgi:SagB-type dehydrogenase family enzyme